MELQEPAPEMILSLPNLAIAFAAFCIWLTVRMINRRERWVKWTLAAVVCMPVLYVASFGPACWLADRDLISGELVDSTFQPFADFCIDSGSNTIYKTARWYGELLPTPQPHPNSSGFMHGNLRIPKSLELLLWAQSRIFGMR
jgi:hypothetical protein